MGTKVKIKLKNGSGIPLVRFTGVHFSGVQFTHDIANGQMQQITTVKNGSISLTAFRASDEQALDTLIYPLADTQGFYAVLLHDTSDPDEPYKLVGEGFEIPPDP